MNGLRTGVFLLVLAHALTGCDGRESSSRPSAPSPVPQPASSPILRVFTEQASGFSTSDVRDAQEQIVQFNTANELIWTADGTRLPGYSASGGNYIVAEKLCQCWLEIRFGTRDGERRAYLTADYGHYNPGTLVKLEIASGVLVMRESTVYPPGTYTLSGVVTEGTPAGQVAVEGARVSRSYGSGWQDSMTDRNGFYQIQGLYDGAGKVSAGKEGYETAERDVTVHGHTRFDIQLGRH